MARHPLDGAVERVKRPHEHLGDLRSRLAPFLDKEDVPAVYADVWETIDSDIRPRMRLQASLRFPILVGEICYNLRTALDYLIYELTKLDTGPPQYKTQFPIEGGKGGEKRFINARETLLRGLCERHVACIEGLQPYKGCDWTEALKTISNPDKHREVTPSKGAIKIYLLVRGEDSAFDAFDAPIWRAPHPKTGEIVEMKPHITGIMTFLDGTPVVETLEKLILKVGETLEAFKPEFK
jgi:hypothetical protein